MKVKNGFIRKAIIFFHWVFKLSNGIGVHCNYCGSIELDIVEKKQGKDTYKSKYKCKRCGAKATNYEIWERGSN